MPHYMFTASYTNESIKAMVGNPQDRGEAVKPLMAALGVTLHDLYFVLGKDDIIAIMEAPDDETAVAGSMVIGASGAFSSGAMTKLMTTSDAVASMKKANAALSSYKSPQSG